MVIIQVSLKRKKAIVITDAFQKVLKESGGMLMDKNIISKN